MKKLLFSIVTATLLACGSAAAAENMSPACPGDARGLMISRGAGLSVRPPRIACGADTKTVLLRGNQNFLSDKELERALKMQLQGRLIDAKLDAVRGEYTVLWEEQEGGRRKLRKLIVDAKTGKVKREIRGTS